MTDEIKQDLEKILKRLDKIEDVINRPYEPYEYPGDNTPQPYYSATSCAKCGMTFEGVTGYYCSATSCAKCGMTFEGVTGYYCPQNVCPTFIRAT